VERNVQPDDWPEIPDHLAARAIGPDWEDITKEEAERRIDEFLAPIFEDPRYWRFWAGV
jgi:hypothetical protein